MSRTKVAIALSSSLILCACAGVTDVVKTGPETFMVASHGTMGWSSGSAQKAKALQQAEAFCASVGKQMEVTSTAETPSGFGKIASGEVHFKCAAK